MGSTSEAANTLASDYFHVHSRLKTETSHSNQVDCVLTQASRGLKYAVYYNLYQPLATGGFDPNYFKDFSSIERETVDPL